MGPLFRRNEREDLVSMNVGMLCLMRVGQGFASGTKGLTPVRPVTPSAWPVRWDRGSVLEAELRERFRIEKKRDRVNVDHSR